MSTLKAALANIISEAFLSCDFNAENLVVQDARSDSGFDYQTAHALQAGSTAELLATRVVEKLRAHPFIAAAEVTGKGFVNILLSDDALLHDWKAVALPHQRIMVDFGGPNIAKPLHVGHLRSLTIGESLRRILIEVGHDVLSDVHFGDWGLPMGQIVSYLLRTTPIEKDVVAYVNSMTDEEFSSLYAASAKVCAESDDATSEAKAATTALQMRDARHVEIWKALQMRSMPPIHAVFSLFDAHFDLELGESDADVEQLEAHCLAADIARLDGNTSLIDVARPEDGKRPLPPLILKKSDGAYTYGATDLATAIERFDEMGIERTIYVVDMRQADHFERLQRAAIQLRIAESSLFHCGFGTVNDIDGRPLRTRAGSAPRLLDLVDDAVAIVSERSPDLSSEDHIAIAIGGLKFADLMSPRSNGYVFQPEEAMAIDGDSGPYVQYACVRARSVLARFNTMSPQPPTALSAAGRALMLEICRLEDAIKIAARDLEPCKIAQQALAIAKAFNRFYAEAPIFGSPDESMRRMICESAVKSLERSTFLLGIKIPNRM